MSKRSLHDSAFQATFGQLNLRRLFMSRAVFNWEDPFLLDEQLTEDERMIRDSAQAFASDILLPRIEKAYLDETTDPDLFRLMGQAGLLGVTLPEEYGAANAGYVSYGLVAREVERIDSGYRSMMSVQSSLVMYPIYAYGSDGFWRVDWLFRSDRTGCGFRSCWHENARRQD